VTLGCNDITGGLGMPAGLSSRLPVLETVAAVVLWWRGDWVLVGPLILLQVDDAEDTLAAIYD
jgi:hypothetical protein